MVLSSWGKFPRGGDSRADLKSEWALTSGRIVWAGIGGEKDEEEDDEDDNGWRE